MQAWTRGSGAVLLGLLLPLGCGSDTAAENQPPTWDDAPTETVALEQGRPLQLAVTLNDPEGDAVTVSEIVAPAGLVGEMSPEGQLVLAAGYEIDGAATVGVRFADAAGLETLVEFSVEVRPLRWLAGTEWAAAAGPEVREHPVALVDEEKGHSYVFHGSGYSPQFEQMLDDVWRLDLSDNSWTQVQPSGDVPTGRGSMRLAMARGQTSGYLWGGYGVPGTDFDELYRVTIVDGTLDFKVIPQVNTPPARTLHGFVYDDVTETFALFGGVSVSTNQLLGDTWTMKLNGDTAEWTELMPATPPSGRYGFFYGMDETSGRMILFSGAQAAVAGDPINAARDVWALDLRADQPEWTPLMQGDAVPPGRRNGSGAWDPVGRRLFVWGGTSDGATTAEGLFVLDARPGKEAWSALPLPDEPGIRSSGVGFYDGNAIRMGFGNGPEPKRDMQRLGY